ncbi:MAG: tail fiber protein [Pseudomonadota bacterium]
MTGFFSHRAGAALLSMLLLLPTGQQAAAQSLTLGDIIMGGWSFCPRNTMDASGQLLAITQNDALFAILGTTYGGDGRTTFALPDMRGRAAMHQGSGPGLTPRRQGQKLGVEEVTLTAAQLPAHNHAISGSAAGQVLAAGATASETAPANQAFAVTAESSYAAAPNVPMGANSAVVTVTGDTTVSGSSSPVSIVDPFATIRFCVVVNGIFPSRN